MPFTVKRLVRIVPFLFCLVAFVLSQLTACTNGIPVASGTDFSEVQIKTIPVSNDIYVLEGEGGNIGVSVGKDGILIVDDQFAPLASRIREALKTLQNGPVKYVVNTHWHGDHTGGNTEFGREATIIAHENVRKRLSGELKPIGRTPAPPMAKEGLPVITFDQSYSLDFNGQEIRAIHLPNGHTDGDSIIFFTGSKVLHTGDHFGPRCFPLIDLGGGGDAEGFERNLASVLQWIPRDTKIIPGHGPVVGIEELEGFHQMLLETIGTVREGMKAGKSLDQIRVEGLPEKWKSWGTGRCIVTADGWIGRIYQSLSRKNSHN